ncbi:MAG: hypothetical protein AAGE92_03890 [Cyanobacteria bacterium P01_G01_bin.4]
MRATPAGLRYAQADSHCCNVDDWLMDLAGEEQCCVNISSMELFE